MPTMTRRRSVTRTQVALALLLAAVVGFGLGWLARGGGFDYAADRFRDSAAALKRMYRQRSEPNTPRQQVLAP
jgi:hypothetical protein